MPLSTPQNGRAARGPAGTAALLRQHNSRSVLEAVAESDTAMRVVEIMQVTGLSRPTVETVTEGLLDQNWVTVLEPDESTTGRGRGRPARLYSFNARAVHVAGVDIGANTIAATVADLRGTSIASIRERVHPDMGAEQRLATTSRAIATLLRRAGLDKDDVLAMTIGTPGTVSPSRDRVGKSPGMPGWPDIDVVGILRDAVSCEVELENDANLAAVGERSLGVARDRDDVLFLLLGERLGAGVMANGMLVRGRDGAAGELGYVRAKGARHRDLQFGPLESVVNASALVALGRAALQATPDSRLAALCGGDPEKLTAQAITLAAGEGDEAASDALRILTRRLAEGVAPALLTLNPEMLVLGGGISRAGEVLRAALERELAEVVLYPPEIRISALGEEAVLAGAVEESLRRVQADVLSRVSA